MSFLISGEVTTTEVLFSADIFSLISTNIATATKKAGRPALYIKTIATTTTITSTKM